NPNSESRISQPRMLLAFTLCLFGAWLAGAGFHATAKLTRSVPQAAGVTMPHYKLPLSFEPNTGQTDPAVKFLSRGPGYSIYLTNGGALLSLQKGGQPLLAGKPTPLATVQSRQSASLRMT